MKKLVILSNESVFSGVVRCGVAEVTDSLANALSLDYEVVVVCPDGNSVKTRTAATVTPVRDGVKTCVFSNVRYYLIDNNKWFANAVMMIDEIKPDILHNMAEPEILGMLTTRPPKAICSFDDPRRFAGKESVLFDYDSVTTNSKNFAKVLLNAGNDLSVVLSKVDFHGVTDGILDTVLAPERGFMVSAKYSAHDITGKLICKQRLKQIYGIHGDPYICLMMCRLIKEKNVEAVLKAIPTIKETGGVLIVVGKGNPVYERELRNFKRSDGVVYVDKWASPVQAAPMTAGADFYIQPSRMESGGLMPMTACHYGAIPIVTLNGGLADNFNDDNAIIVHDDDTIDAVRRAAELYNDKSALADKRKLCMRQDFSWKTRKMPYIELYEKE